MRSCEQLVGLLLSENGFEYTTKRVCELIIKIILSVDGDVVFKNIDRILRLLIVLRATGGFNDDICDTITKRGG